MHKYMNHKEIFDNRDMATQKLLNVLPEELASAHNTLFIGINLGGAYIAQKLGEHFNQANDILLSQHIKTPNNEQQTIAIVTESEDIVIHHQLLYSFDISEDFIYNEARRKYDHEILDMRYKIRQGDDLVDVKDKTVILVDDAVETGFSMYGAIKSMISLGAKSIYLLTPIIDKIAYSNLLSICDGIYSPNRVINYVSTEHYYKKLKELSYKDIIVRQAV